LKLALDEYKIGSRQKHESIFPEGLIRAGMPALEKPWWKKEIDVLEKCRRPLQGRTKR
jgi:hypothetical protein